MNNKVKAVMVELIETAQRNIDTVERMKGKASTSASRARQGSRVALEYASRLLPLSYHFQSEEGLRIAGKKLTRLLRMMVDQGYTKACKLIKDKTKQITLIEEELKKEETK